MHGDSRDLPGALSYQTLIYQNRQLARLVRDLRKLVPKRSPDLLDGEVNQVQLLRNQIDDLETGRVALYARLEASKARICDLQRVQSVVSARDMAPSDNSINDPHHSLTNQQDDFDITKEMARVQTSLALALASCQGIVKEATYDIEIFNLNSDRNMWVQKAASAAKNLSETFEMTESKLNLIRQTSLETEQTFLSEVGKVAEELAQRHNELRRSQLLVSDLEQRMRHSLSDSTAQSQSELLATGGQKDSVNSVDLLRVKDEQCTRLLAQHLQLQHRLTSLEQEIAVLRRRDSFVNDLLDRTTKDLEKFTNHDLAQAEYVRSLHVEVGKLEQLLSSVQVDLSNIRTGMTQVDELNKTLKITLASAQSEFQQTIQNLREDYLQRAQTGGPRQIGVANSLIEIELDELRLKVRCPLCHTRPRTVALLSCMHSFCRECVDEKMLNARNRKCPLCMQRFADADVRRLM
jgi:hypothetical protein